MNAPHDSHDRLTDDDARLTERIELRLTEEERIDYQKCAERSGLSLAQWMRDRLAHAARREAKDAYHAAEPPGWRWWSQRLHEEALAFAKGRETVR